MKKKMTKQEAFDYAVGKLLEQGERSVSTTAKDYKGDWKCLYRGRNGRKCAVGWLIDDEDYDPIIDQDFLAVWSQKVVSLLPEGLDIDMLEELQDVHDSYPPHEWLDAFQNVAVRYMLEWNFDNKGDNNA